VKFYDTGGEDGASIPKKLLLMLRSNDVVSCWIWSLGARFEMLALSSAQRGSCHPRSTLGHHQMSASGRRQ
jgi:hypothetical protein